MASNKWDLESVFIGVMGLAMAVLFTVAPFVHTKARTGDSMLEQVRSYEEICQTVTAEEARTLKGGRRC